MSVLVKAVPALDPEDDVIRAALVDIVGAVEVPQIIESLDGEAYDAAGEAWQRMAEAIAAELRPKVVALVDEAYARRMPWRWPPA